jgi:peroxiredoxin Q/BCP
VSPASSSAHARWCCTSTLDETPGCTAEACSFRDAYEDFRGRRRRGGVSADDADSHRFKARHRLPFTLVSDPDGSAARALGVKKTLGLFAGRVSFVIDRQGSSVTASVSLR